MIEIKRTKEINWDTPLNIDRFALPDWMPKQYFDQFKANSAPNTPDETIIRAVNNLIIDNTVFDYAMNMIVKNYDIKYDGQDLVPIAQNLRQNYSTLASAPDAYVFSLASNFLIKSYVFEDLAKEWNIVVNDEEVKKSLEEYYKKTNISIRDEMNDPNKFKIIKEQLFERKMIQAIIAKVHPVFDWEKLNKQISTFKYK